mmetsp:Transcript_6658/g.16408  ORF Transcript_6658/g.16408 Transcript_6658/m.16408 type:complete len:115 (+) Transcript_6658:17-361(+)
MPRNNTLSNGSGIVGLQWHEGGNYNHAKICCSGKGRGYILASNTLIQSSASCKNQQIVISFQNINFCRDIYQKIIVSPLIHREVNHSCNLCLSDEMLCDDTMVHVASNTSSHVL